MAKANNAKKVEEKVSIASAPTTVIPESKVKGSKLPAASANGVVYESEPVYLAEANNEAKKA